MAKKMIQTFQPKARTSEILVLGKSAKSLKSRKAISGFMLWIVDMLEFVPVGVLLKPAYGKAWTSHGSLRPHQCPQRCQKSPVNEVKPILAHVPLKVTAESIIAVLSG